MQDINISSSIATGKRVGVEGAALFLFGIKQNKTKPN